MEKYNMLLLLIFLAIVAIMDVKTKKISLKICIIFGMAGMILAIIRLVIGEYELADMLLGMAIGIVLMIIAKLTNEAIGIGDGAVLAVVGIHIGAFKTLELLIIAFVLSAVVGMVLWIGKRKTKKEKIAFVPFMMLGYLISLI